MGLFKKIFGGERVKKEEKILPWIPLNSLEQIKYIKKTSSIKPQVIFKHSTRCGISTMVLKQFVDQYNFSENELDLYYLDLLSYRNVSDEVGYTFQVLHESPQLLVIKNGTLVVHASHGQINAIDLGRFV